MHVTAFLLLLGFRSDPLHRLYCIHVQFRQIQWSSQIRLDGSHIRFRAIRHKGCTRPDPINPDGPEEDVEGGAELVQFGWLDVGLSQDEEDSEGR